MNAFDNKSSTDQRRSTTNKWIVVLLVVTILYILLAPFILTRGGSSNLDFTNTGQIGDTIGGVTAPIIGLFSAILVFISFREQIRANNLILDLRNEDLANTRLSTTLSVIKADIDNFRYNDYVGAQAVLAMYRSSFNAYADLNDKADTGIKVEYATIYESQLLDLTYTNLLLEELRNHVFDIASTETNLAAKQAHSYHARVLFYKCFCGIAYLYTELERAVEHGLNIKSFSSMAESYMDCLTKLEEMDPLNKFDDDLKIKIAP